MKIKFAVKSLAAVLLISAFGLLVCVDRPFHSRIENAVIDYGKSDLYSDNELKEVGDKVVNDFVNGHDRDLLKLEYKGDNYSLEKLTECNSVWNTGDNYLGYRLEKCAVFTTEYQTWDNPNDPSYGSNEVYSNWEYVYVQDKNGKWILISEGYAS